MRQLIEFIIYDFRQYILLVFFCLLSIGLLVNRETPALKVIRGSCVELFGAIETPLRIWNRYFGLVNENQDLLITNAQLAAETSRMRTALIENKKLRELLQCKDETPRQLRLAHVIDRTFHPGRNLFLMDCGSTDSIDIGMAVLNDKGLVGRVILTSPHFSMIQPIINTDFKVSVISEKSRLLGVVNWTGGDVSKAELIHIPSSRKIEVGEKLLTTDFSSFANANIVVGEVETIEAREGDLFQSIRVRLAVDFSTIEHLLVDLSKPNTELQQLRARYKEFQ